jgi:hypothetical protein
MYSPDKRPKGALVAFCATVAAICMLAASAQAATVYPPGGGSFKDNAQGWETVKAECNVLSLLPLPPACKSTGEWDEVEGNPAGSLRAEIAPGLQLLDLLIKSKVEFQSPVFKVGEGGLATLRLDRRFVPGGLVKLEPKGNYQVTLEDVDLGVVLPVKAETLEEETSFGSTAAPAVEVKSGHRYVIRIAANISSTAEVSVPLLLEKSADLWFDNVSLSVPSAGEPGGSGAPGQNGGNGAGTNGNGGNNGKNGNGKNGAGGGAGGVSGARLESLIKSSSLVGRAVLKGNRLTVRAKCPAKVKATCTLRIQGLLNRHRTATTGRRARVRKGKTKRFVLKVRPAVRKRVKKRGRLLFKEVARVGKSRATVYRSLRLARR